MERHYELDNSSNNKRVLRNQDLYKTIYEDIEYTNVEGITSIGRTKDINISQIQDLLKSREEYKRERESDIKIDRHLLEIPEEEEKNYDIKDIISRAKDERVEVDNKKRSLENEKYNILKKLDATKNKTYESIKDIEKEEKELKELLHTLTSTAMLNKMSDNDISVDLFDDLKGKTNTVATSTSIRSVLNKAKDEYKQEEDDDTQTMEIDNSFYTNSSGLKAKDFEDLQEVSKAMRKNNILIVIVLVVLFVILLCLGIYFGMQAF